MIARAGPKTVYHKQHTQKPNNFPKNEEYGKKTKVSDGSWQWGVVGLRQKEDGTISPAALNVFTTE
jgi:hypothetical protein